MSMACKKSLIAIDRHRVPSVPDLLCAVEHDLVQTEVDLIQKAWVEDPMATRNE